jgi:hypothetical protein
MTIAEAKARLREQGAVFEHDLDAKVDVLTRKLTTELKRASLWAALGGLGIGVSGLIPGLLGGGRRRRGRGRSQPDDRHDGEAGAAARRGGLMMLLLKLGRMALPLVLRVLTRRARARRPRD